MFKLIKLAIYAIAGYAIYQFYLGMNEQGQSSGSFGGRREEANENAGDVGGARMTGGGKGQVEKTEEPSGMSASNRVGRGVVAR